jgi:hypothetical protein
VITEEQKKYFYELAVAFVDTDHVLSNELRDRAEDIVVEKELPWDDFPFVWEMLREGAILCKLREIIKDHEDCCNDNPCNSN